MPPALSSAVETQDAARPSLRVGFVLTDQFTLTAFSGFIDVLRLAADHGGRSRQIHAAWTVMSADGEPRTSSSGQTMANLQPLLDPAAFDYIAICGGNDYESSRVPDALLEWLRSAVAVRTLLVGICTGTFTLAQADVVGPRTVCIHWNVLDVFRSRFPKVNAVVDRLFIDEGDLITCAGSTAAVDLGLYLVGRHCGRDKAQQAMRHMMLQGIRPANMPQPHFYEDLAHLGDVRVRQAAHFIEQRVDNPPSLDAIARYVGVSARQLERAFNAALGMSPMAFYRHVRLQYGRWLLLNNAGSITRIAHDCGYSDGAHFSREFRAHFGMNPRSFLRQNQNRCDNVTAIASPVSKLSLQTTLPRLSVTDKLPPVVSSVRAKKV